MTKRISCVLLLSLLTFACSTKGEAPPSSESKSTPKQAAAEAQSPAQPKAADGEEQAPARFTVKLETTKGDILMDVTREWAPKGADRFYTLVKSGFFNDVAFFRVISGFMVQVGISGDPALNAKWRTKRIPDDPVKQSNVKGMVSFASAGPNSRTTQIFINYSDNARLDRMGFAPFAKVREMQVAESLYAGYGEGAPRGKGPNQGRMQAQGNAYLKSDFPELDYIKRATVVAP